MRKVLVLCIFLLTNFLVVVSVQAATTKSISKFGITWHFDKAYEYGQFANGDYWVLGPVTITRIEPDYNGSINGWEVNPSVSSSHGFSNTCKNGGFNSSKVPSLPYKTSASVESIVKTIGISGSSQQPCVQTAAVLTVVNQIPPNGGSTVFRPPYVGTSKPFYFVNSLRTDLLPSYPSVGSPPSLSSIESDFSPLWLDHVTGAAGRDIRPSDAMENYPPKNSPKINNAVLRLMLNDSVQSKMSALIKFTQFAIDRAHAAILGYTAPATDGHNPNHRVVAAWAATLLDIEAAKNVLNTETGFHEDKPYLSVGNNDRPLWGESTSESQYWDYVMGLGGSRSRKDPYGYIDGGTCGSDYQLIVSQSWKGQVLSTNLMPSLQTAWNPNMLKITTEYIERWVNHGTWAQPDPCAPFDGNTNNYGKTFGPKPGSPGQCIAGSGRFPEKNGTSKDGGLYRSDFVAAMWNTYYNKGVQVYPQPDIIDPPTLLKAAPVVE